jgi:hypothetical protein
MVLEWIRSNNFYFQVPAEMLAKFRDTFSLAIIRQPLFDIYNNLKTCYNSKIYPTLQVYTRLLLNTHELARLKLGGFKYIYFSTFLIF